MGYAGTSALHEVPANPFFGGTSRPAGCIAKTGPFALLKQHLLK